VFEICQEIERWIERRIEEPIRRAREDLERVCRRRPWWDPRRWFCEIVRVVVWVVEWVVRIVTELITEVVCRLVVLVLVFVGFLLSLIMSIPVLGGLITVIVRALWWLVSLILGAITWVGEQLFGRPRKTLRVRAIVFADENGPLATAAEVQNQINTANAIFAQCNVEVRLIDLHIYRDRVNAADLLDYADCDSFWNIMDRTFWVRASQYELEAGSNDYEKNWRRFVPIFGGYVTLFVVRSMGDEVGCSHGPFADHIAVIDAGIDPASRLFDPNVVAHELGHACTLQHEDDRPGDLMFPTSARTGTNLTAGDCFWVRSAAFVTYL
jgi:hypothetical protein